MRGISYEHVYVVDFSSKIVTIGLGLLWISGIGFLVHYGVFEPAKLQNPKIWAKIAIVAVLSINGLLVHYFVLPRIRNQVGKRLLDGLSPFDCSLVLLAGTVSAISWYVPLILGAIPQLNYVVPAEVILSSYALCCCGEYSHTGCDRLLLARTIQFPSFQTRSKMNILHGSLALALGSICVSLFVTKTTDHGDGACRFGKDSSSLVNRKSPRSKNQMTRIVAGLTPGSRLELEQSHTGALRECSGNGCMAERRKCY